MLNVSNYNMINESLVFLLALGFLPAPAPEGKVVAI